jgi:hypothetical protein
MRGVSDVRGVVLEPAGWVGEFLGGAREISEIRLKGS